MKILIVKSATSDVPLAEIRTDGRTLSFIVDNTNGKLPKMTKNSYTELVRIVKSSSHLSIEEPQAPTAHLLRYVLDNGDVVEITTDGHTAILNGKLLDEQEKEALFGAIRNKQINISRKADINAPVPVMPTVKIKPKQEPKSANGISPEMMNLIKQDRRKKDRDEEIAGPNYDPEIEAMDFKGEEDPEYAKRMVYFLRYGDKNDRRK